MRITGRTLAVTCAALLMALSPAAAVDIDASFNRDTVRVGEIAELTIAVSGTVTGVGRPEVPAVDYLTVVSSSSQKSIELIDGQMRSTTAYTFGIRASREGTYEIPPIDLPVDDRVLTTRSLTLTVIPPATDPRRPPPGHPPDFEDLETDPDPVEPRPDIDATTEVDDPTPWVGQQVTLTLTFMQSHRASLVGNAEYSPPSTEGLVAEPLPDEGHRTVWIEGVPFEETKRKTALFAHSPGDYTIGPAEIIFRRSYMRGQERITTDPIALNVRSLPQQGRPAGFSGIVGRLQTRISSSAGQVRLGEALSLRLEVSGTGDLRQLEAPEITVDGDARVDPGGAERDISPQHTPSGHRIGGTVVFDYLLVPREVGTLRVNPLVVHYFNPETGRYESAQTSQMEIDVQPGDPGQIAVEERETELRYIKEGRRGLSSRALVTGSPWFWGAQVIPLLALGWALRRRVEMLRRAQDPRYRRRVEAAGEARARLRLAARIGAPADLYRRADEALAGYLAAKTGGSASAVSPTGAREMLVEAGAGEDLAQRTADTLETLRAGAYAPGAGEQIAPEEVLERVRQLIDALEGALR